MERFSHDEPDTEPDFTRMLKGVIYPEEDILNIRRDIVMTYSQTRLTKHTDRLVALSDLAKAFGSKLPQNQYLAGMWQQSDLLGWSVKSVLSSPTSSTVKQEKQKYCAPSFCWASAALPCQLYVYWKAEGAPYTIMDIQFQHTTKAPTGPVVAWHLDIFAKLKAFRFDVREDLHMGSVSETSMLGLKVVDGVLQPGKPLRMHSISLDRAPDFPANTEHDYFFIFDQYAEFKELIKERIGEEELIWVNPLYAAQCVLLAVVDAETRIYRRIGMTVSWDSNVLAFKGFERSLQYGQHELLRYKTPQVTIRHRRMRGEEHIFRVI
ncbi:hypothetical protein PspLS_08582 [Pyricularia sp. CBS 133598]|nr:hypothetical protein PspLS_08582 [Pyricularia sp. CBS 133598]